MALSIGITTGDKILIDNHTLCVKSVRHNNTVVSVDNGPDFHLDDKQRTEILPEVFVFTGDKPSDGHAGSRGRLAFEAPTRIRINRVPC